jgi:type II secretory pathway pseudopilin PulG
MNRRNQKGFTLVEITIILLVLVILGAIFLPAAERFVDLARIARVREDIGAIAAVIELWKFDTCSRWFHVDGDSNAFTDGNRVDMLIGDGDTPPTSFIPASNDDFWSESYGLGNFVDTISNHLALGDPFFPTDNTAATSPYPVPNNSSVYACGFRGAYISTPISADPWGNRYMVNVAWLGAKGTRDFGVATQVLFNQFDVFVLSAGPDETVDTEFQPGSTTTPVGVVAQGDDQIAVINGGV